MVRSIIILLLAVNPAFGQKFIAQKSKVSFFSTAPLENITAWNSRSSGLLDAGKGEFAFSVPIKDFKFEKSLMREHFNENYMESDRFPKATFTGTLTGFNSSTDSEQRVSAKGKLTIHGVTRDVDIPGTIRKVNGVYNVSAKFPVRLADYNIKIPELLWQKIAEEVEVSVEYSMRPQ